jgi:hypothetical protein
LGEDGFVFDEFEIVHANTVARSDELDGLQGAVADVDSPSGTRAGHADSSVLSQVA